VHVFISYNRSDAQSASRQLAEALKHRFGPEHFFFDTSDITAGVEWRTDAVRRVQAADIVLAVIGPHWAPIADDHTRRNLRDRAAEDLLRLEIETAFTHGAIVIPVLVDDAEMPARETLPRPFRPLAEVQAQTLHHASWHRDIDALAEILAHLRARPGRGNRRRARQSSRVRRRAPTPSGSRATSSSARSYPFSGRGPMRSTARRPGNMAPGRCPTPRSWRATSQGASRPGLKRTTWHVSRNMCR
jgi:hypothetical protein